MDNQFSLFKKRKFTAMFFVQFLGAFNDNVFKQALILILTYTAAAKLGVSANILNNLAAMLFILPYILFSALAGQVADKYPKAILTQRIKLLEIIIMTSAGLALIFELYPLIFLCLFLTGVQSAFFGPIKYAYLPENMHSRELVSANGLFQMGTSLSILVGMIFAGILTQINHAFYWTAITFFIVAILGYLAALAIPNNQHANPSLNINWNIIKTNTSIIAYLYRLPLLFFIVMGNSWFWFYGATFLTQTPEFSKSVLHGNESVVILLLTLLSIGTALGSVLCKALTKNKVSLALLPIAIFGLSACTIALYVVLSQFTALPDGVIYGIGQVIAMSGSIWVMALLFLLGFFCGMYIVPLYAFMQAYAPISHRARIVGANNIFNALFMVVSAVFAMIILGVLKLSIAQLFLINGIINAIFGVFLYKKLHQYKDTMPLVADNTPMV